MRINTIHLIIITSLLGIVILGAGYLRGHSTENGAPQEEEINLPAETSGHLVVLWTSGDREVALKMVFMYVLNSKKYEWWEEITLLVWGPSAKLLSEDIELQEQIKIMKKAGIELKGCKACADLYGVTAKLEEVGVEVIYIGKDLTDYIKGDYELVTF